MLYTCRGVNKWDKTGNVTTKFSEATDAGDVPNHVHCVQCHLRNGSDALLQNIVIVTYLGTYLKKSTATRVVVYAGEVYSVPRQVLQGNASPLRGGCLHCLTLTSLMLSCWNALQVTISGHVPG